MYNPFTLLSVPLLHEKIQAGKRYFVRQTYKRGMQPRLIAAFLLRAYDEKEKNLAGEHLLRLKNDGNAYMYDSQDRDDLKKLQVAASQPFGYKVFYAGKMGADWKPPVDYQARIRKYVRAHFPRWQAAATGQKEDRTIAIGLHEEFGQLFLKFNYNTEIALVPLQEIENY